MPKKCFIEYVNMTRFTLFGFPSFIVQKIKITVNQLNYLRIQILERFAKVGLIREKDF